MLFSCKNSTFLVGVPGFEPGASWTRRPISNFFRAFYVVFNPFCSNPIHLQTSLTTRFPCVPKRCVVCSVVRNAPPTPADVFHRQGGGSAFLLLAACIITRMEGWNKLFLRCPRLRNWGGCKQRISAAAVNLDPSAYSEALGVGPVGHRQQR